MTPGHYSDDLPHFPQQDPPSTTERRDDRSKLQQDIDAFLAQGGTISEHGIESGVHYPIRQTKKALVNFLKRRSFRRNKG